MDKTTYFYPNRTVNARGLLVDCSSPLIMGILNVTPDSFYDGGQYQSAESALQQASEMVAQGADILDIGGMSTRPGARMITAEEELTRVIPVITAIAKAFPHIPVSIDTVHGLTAREAIAAGARMINDVSAGTIDASILEVAASTKTPYILMHMQGRPEHMQKAPVYTDVVSEVLEFLTQKILELRALQVHDIIIDPGFGFGKSLEHNYALLQRLDELQALGLPMLAGVSRKSMVCKLLQVDPKDALNGSTALHTILLLKGVQMIRVHDVREAVQARAIVQAMQTV